jgi:putative effector of murein hydrolase LrgA (UPF0299 family)
MKTLINKLTIPALILLAINFVGFVFHKNYEGAVVGSIVGMIVAFLALEIKAKYE